MTARRALVLALCAAMFVGGLAFGVKLLTTSADTAAAAATCTNRTITAGEQLTSNLVTVNVFNASRRAGLANRVTINLQRKGFLAGQIGNSLSDVTTRTVTILTNDPQDPRVILVAAQFSDRVSYAKPDVTLGRGVTVLVGDDYTSLAKRASTRVRASSDVTTCVPTVRVS